MAAEQAAEAGEQHVPRHDARRRGPGAAQEAAQAAAAAEDAARLGLGILRLGVLGLGILGLLILRLRRLDPRIGGRLRRRGGRDRRRGGRGAPEEAAPGLRLARRLGAELGQFRLGPVEGLVGHDGVLDQHIGRVRAGAKGVVDHRRRLGILEPGGGVVQIHEKSGQKLAFLRCHRSIRMVCPAKGPIGDGQSAAVRHMARARGLGEGARPG